jgi:hypothetical protein
MVVMVQHVVEKVCKDEAVQISGRNKHNKMFWCMVLRGVLKNLENADFHSNDLFRLQNYHRYTLVSYQSLGLSTKHPRTSHSSFPLKEYKYSKR